MPDQLQLRGGTTAQHASFTGASKEVTVDTTKKTLVVHDGSTAGGNPLLREDQSNLPTTAPTRGIYNASGSLAISTGGSGRLFVDASGNVGVGGSPSEKLHVQGAGIRIDRAGGDPYVDFYTSGSANNVAIYGGATTGFRAFVGGSERLRITAAGLVGIGTSTPGGLLHVSGGRTLLSSSDGYELAFARTGNYFYWYNDGGNLSGKLSLTTSAGAGGGEIITFTQDTKRVGIGTTSPGQTLSLANATAPTLGFLRGSTLDMLLSSEAAGAAIQTYNNTPIQFSVVSGSSGFSERARIDSSGRLLVGTSSARSNFYNATSTASIQIEGTTSNTSSLSLVSNNTSTSFEEPSFVLGRSNGAAIGSNTVAANDTPLGRISFQGNDGTQFVEAASIRTFVDGASSGDDVPGRLVFSTTADGASSPTERMRISNNGTHAMYGLDDILYSSTNRGAGTTYATYVGRYGATSTTTGTISFLVFSNGNVQNTNNSYGAYSDVKLKENIVDAGSQWDDLKALQVRKYNFKEGQTHTQIGLVAQEVELVSPGLVTESPDRDAEGNDLGTVTKSVNYSVLYMKAVKALQEAMERIEQLESEMAAVKAQLP